MDTVFKSQCINPLNLSKHTKKLVKFPRTKRAEYSAIPESARICTGCKSQMYKRKLTDDVVPSVNDNDDEIHHDQLDYHAAGIAVLNNMKKKFLELKSSGERISLLTLAPQFWSISDLERVFGCSNYEARLSKKLFAEKGLLPEPVKKKGKVLADDTISLVQDFYNSDDVSRVMPGMKDFVSVKQENGTRKHVQKRLVLGNLREIYNTFQEHNPTVKIGFTKFTQLRPPQCVLADSSGTHNVCVCVHHENMKLMFDAAGIDDLTKNSQLSFIDCQSCVKSIVCSQPEEKCFFGDCLDCPNSSKLREHLLECFSNNGIFEVKYDNWFQTDRCTIASQLVNTHEFVDIFAEKLMKFKTHDFLAKQQSLFVHNLKKVLEVSEFIVSMDFAENYAFVIQDSTQSFHWNNNQATVFTVVIYYKSNSDLLHKSMAIISDNLCHDSIAVYEYQKIVLDFLKKNFEVKKIYYITDGASQHFKNKTTFQNLLFHKRDFNVEAEWHFFPTAHGKSGCDGIGANLKRGARKASLQNTSRNRILTAEDLYKWAKGQSKETEVFFSDKESYKEAALKLKERVDKAKMIPGTLRYHAFIPLDENTFKLRHTSLSSIFQTFPKISNPKIKKSTFKKTAKVKKNI